MMTSVFDDALYYRLFSESEKARWKMGDIPWNAIEKDKVTKHTLDVVRTLFTAELTTYNATEQFLAVFKDDPDFTQWVTVWLYEETKHPQAWLRYLTAFGEVFDGAFLMKGRETTKFLPSKMTTLAMNVFSEVSATHSYLTLAANAKDPVLKQVARCLAADEARHASHFLAYARKLLAEGTDRARMLADAAVVPYIWMTAKDDLSHPVNAGRNALRALGKDNELACALVSARSEKAEPRACLLIGELIGHPLRSLADVKTTFNELSAAAAQA
jgi:hypothetical protein